MVASSPFGTSSRYCIGIVGFCPCDKSVSKYAPSIYCLPQIPQYFEIPGAWIARNVRAQRAIVAYISIECAYL